MRSVRFLLLLIILAALLPAASHSVEADGAVVDALSFRSSSDALLIDFTVKNLATPKLVETLDSGLPIRFVYHVKFVRRAGALTSGVVNDIKFERVVEKDNLKNRYRIIENGDTTELSDFAAAMEALGAVRGVEVALLSDLIEEKRYQVEVQVKLEEFRLPFHLHRILPFLSMWDITTPWKVVRVPAEYTKRP